MATVESIHASLKIDTKDFIRGIKEAFGVANKESESFKSSTDKTKKGFDDVTKSVDKTKKETSKLKQEIDSISTEKPNQLVDTMAKLGATLGIGLIGKKIIDIGSSFEATMSKVKAATGAGKESMAELEKVARELGATTQFSASEAASAMVELGKAGLSTEKIISSTKDVLNLAAAGELSLAEAAEIAADTMSQMNLAANQTGRIANVMAKAANSSTISVRDLSETFKMAAPNANALGISLEELASMTAILGSAGIKGSTAGEKLRSIFSRLVSPTKEAAELLQKYNIEILNSDKTMKSASEIMGQMQVNLKNLGDVEKANIISSIFGMENVAGALALIKSGKEGIDSMTDSMKNSAGYAKQFGDEVNNNLSGAFKQMNSALEETILMLWDELKPAVITIVKGFTEIVSGVTKWAKENPNLSKTIIQATLAIGALVMGIMGVGGLITAFSGLGIGLTATRLAISVFGSTLAREALMAQAKWLAILGPFGLALGVTALVLTLTYNIIERRQQENVESAGNIGTIAGVSTAMTKSKSEREAMLLDLNKIETEIVASTGSAEKFNKAVSKLRPEFSELKNSLLGITHIPLFGRSVDEVQKSISNFRKGMKEINSANQEAAKSAKPAAQNIRSIGNSASSAKKELDDVITTGKILEQQFGKAVSFKAEVEISSEKSKQEVDELKKKYNELGYEFKVLGFKPEGDKQKLEFEIVGNTDRQVQQTDNLLRGMKNLGQSVKYVSASNKEAFNKQYPNEFYDSLKNINASFEDFKNADSIGQKIASGMEMAKTAVQSVGKEFNKFMQATAQLEQVKFQNFSQNLQFITTGLVQYIDNQTNLQLSGIEAEIQAITDKQNEIERLEQEHQERMQEIIEAYRLQRSDELDEEFNREVERLNEEFRLKQESLLANTSSQAEQAAILKSVEADRLNAINTLQAQFQERLRQDTEKKRKEEDAKSKEQKEKNKADGQNDLLTLEQLNARKEELTRKSELEKQRVKKISALIEWQAGKAAFEANKRAQVASAQIAMVSTILSGIQAWAMLTATTGPLGLVAGAAFLATITGLALGAGAMTISAAQSQQYPPPPIFMNTGGIVPGMGNTDSVPAMLTPGEMVIDRETTSKLQENVDKMGTFTVNMTNNIYSSNAEDIADQISTILYDKIEGRFMNG